MSNGAVDKEWKGASFKEEEDYSKEVNAALDKINATTAPVLLRSSTAAGKAGILFTSASSTTTSSFESLTAAGTQEQQKAAVVEELLEPLFALEKKARLGSDVLSCKRVATEIMKIYRTLGLYDSMLTLMLTLMKKRAQSKPVQMAIVEECAVVLSDGSVAPTSVRREEVLERLAYATENKIHVELQHARFTAELAKVHEAKGQKQKACEMLSALQVETITTMPRIEKLQILNMQIRLALELDLPEHIPSLSRKISYRALAREEALEQKLHYFELLREYYTRNESYFHVGRCWLETFFSLSNDTSEQIQALRRAVVFFLIADYSTPKQLEDGGEFTAFSPDTRFADRASALMELSERFRSNLESIPIYHSLLKRFNSIVLVREKVMEDVERVCATDDVLSGFPARQDLLRSRCGEHDLMVVSTFYNRVPIARLAELVGLSEAYTEQFLMNLVGNGILFAKMDRVDGLVEFEAKKNTLEVVEYWSDAVEQSVSLLDEVSHLITKEQMLANVQRQQQGDTSGVRG